MRKLLTLLIAVLLISSSSLWGQTTSITISGQSQWESTGVTITPEMAVTIEASGQWCGAPWSCYGPEGTGGIAPSIFLAPGLSSGGLVGKVGNNSPFFVGSTCSFNGQDHGTGTLYLAFNDEITGYYNNSGTLDVTITTTEEGGQTDLTAPFSVSPPTIDGVISGTEWQNAQSYDLTFHSNVDQTTCTTTVYFLHDGTFLYCASTVPFPSAPTAYFGVYIDGDHSHSINGTMSEPHTDLGYNKAGTNSPLYPIYDTYWAEVPPCGVLWSDMVTPPAGAQHAYSGTSELSYEFKIPLSDMTVTPGETIGIHLMFSPGGVGYMYPSADYCDIASWPDLYIEPSSEQDGDVLVYSTSGTYPASSFDDDLPSILEAEGFTVTITDRASTPVISSTMLAAYDELWILSTNPYSGSGGFSASEISDILAFRSSGKGLLIMADDGPPGHSYIGDANQISVPLGATFSGQYNYGPYSQPFQPDFSPHPLFSGVQSIVCTENASILSVNSPVEVVATHEGTSMIAALDDGNGRAVFDVSFARLFDGDILIGNTPQYVKNIANWLSESPPSSCLSITNYEISRGINGLTSWLPQYSVHKVGCVNETVKLVVTYSNSCGVPAAAALNVELTTPAGDVYDYILGFLATESAGEAELVLESGAFEFVGKYKLIVSVDEPLWEEEFYLIYETPTDLGDYTVSQTLCYTEDVDFDYDNILEATLNGSFIWNAETITLPNHLTPTNDVSDAVDRLRSLSHTLITYCEYDHQCPEVEPPRRWHPRVEEILRKKTGVCQDYSYCLAAMCRVIGIPARTVFGDPRPPITYDPEAGRENSHCGCFPYTSQRWPHVWAEAYVGESGNWSNLDNGWIHVGPTGNTIDNPCQYTRGEYNPAISGDNGCSILAKLPDGCGEIRDHFYEKDCEKNGQQVVNATHYYVSEEPCEVVEPPQVCNWLCEIEKLLTGVGNFIWGVVTGSPVDIHVYDPNGNHLGFDQTGEIEYGIYNALFYQLEDNHQFVFGDSLGESYYAIIKGRESGVYQLAVLMPVYGQSVLVEYNDVPTDSGARDSILIGIYTDHHPLFLDSDGDGAFDDIRYPDAVKIGSGEGDVGSIAGAVQNLDQGLYGVPVDLCDTLGNLISTTCTDSVGRYDFDSLISGAYTVSIATPLGFIAEHETKTTSIIQGFESLVDFSLTALDIAGQQRGVGYWRHQVNVYLSGKGNAHESLEQMSGYMNAIATHFNGNLANPVNIFEVPQPAAQIDSLEVLRDLLAAGHKSTMNEKARRHLAALLLNVASFKLHQSTIISEDSATASQGITYCYLLITDGNPDNDEAAKDIAEMINEGQVVPSGMIDPATANIAYKHEDSEQLPTKFALSQNYPNPFNPVTEINFALPNAADVKLEIFNIMGQRVAVLAEGPLDAGYHSVIWDGSRVASGVYFYRLDAGDFVESRKMVLLK